MKRKRKGEPAPNPTFAADAGDLATLLPELLLGVHSAPSREWLADAGSTAAERGLGALYGLLFLVDAGGQLSGQRPASSERVRALVKVDQALETNVTSLRFDPAQRPAVASALLGGRVVSLSAMSEALPASIDAERANAAQRQLNVAEVWVVPLHWGGEGAGVLLLFMPANAPGTPAQAELLGRHLAVALANLRTKEEGRKRGEVDAVRWVYDEQRFMEELTQEIRRAQRHRRPLSILLLRLRNLPELRARYGRFLAERVLRQIGGRLAEAMRDTDFLGAYRDDGFACILVEADRAGAGRAQERLLADTVRANLPLGERADLAPVLTCATATLGEDGDTAQALAAAAEARLDQEGQAQEVA